MQLFAITTSASLDFPSLTLAPYYRHIAGELLSYFRSIMFEAKYFGIWDDDGDDVVVLLYCNKSMMCFEWGKISDVKPEKIDSRGV